MRHVWPFVAVLLATGQAGAQPLEQRFEFGAPPDVLGNRQIGRLAPVPALQPAPAATPSAKRRPVRGRPSRRLRS